MERSGQSLHEPGRQYHLSQYTPYYSAMLQGRFPLLIHIRLLLGVSARCSIKSHRARENNKVSVYSFTQRPRGLKQCDETSHLASFILYISSYHTL